MAKQFNRVANCIIRLKTQEIDVSKLRIMFEVEKDVSYLSNLLLLKVYNLSESSRNKISQEYQGVILKAGYGENPNIIFNGSIRNVFHIREQENMVSWIYCADGDAYSRKSITQLTTGPNKSLEQLIKDLAGQLLDENGNAPAIGEINITNGNNKIKGLVISGKTSEALNLLADSYRFNWFIDSGTFYAVGETQYLENSPVTTTSPTTGMIESPILTETGVDVKTLLNPSVSPGRQFRIKSAGTSIQLGLLYFQNVPVTVAEGKYKVLRVKHIGDTRGNDWYSEIETLKDWTVTGSAL